MDGGRKSGWKDLWRVSIELGQGSTAPILCVSFEGLRLTVQGGVVNATATGNGHEQRTDGKGVQKKQEMGQHWELAAQTGKPGS